MDPRRRADEVLARASARGAFVVTPDNATSPMDVSATVRISRDLLPGARQDEQHPSATHQQRDQQAPISWPQHESGQVPQQPAQDPPHQQGPQSPQGPHSPQWTPQQYPQHRY